MLDWLIELDQRLLLFFNGMNCPFGDSFMTTVTRTATWALFFAALLAVVCRVSRCGETKKTIQHAVLLIVMIALVVFVADRFSSGVCKPLFARCRPCNEPLFWIKVHLVNNSHGSMYGFFSSHAANTFGVAMFLALLLRRRWLTVSCFAWAVLCSYSRIYLGKHYPGDILCGALWGLFAGYVIFRLYSLIARRRSLTPAPLTGWWSRAVPLSLGVSLVACLVIALFK